MKFKEKVLILQEVNLIKWANVLDNKLPDLMMLVAFVTLTMHGIPYSLATTAPI